MTDDGSKPPEPDDAKSRLDTDLLRRLLGERPGQDVPEDNPLERAVRGMRSAHERIAARDTSDATRGIQQQVVEDLAKLIELAKQPPPRQNNPPPPPQPPQSDQDSESQNQSDQQREQPPSEQSQEQDGPAEAQQQQQSDRARESADRPGDAQARQAELDRRQHLIDGVWGHLPPSARQKILSRSGDEYLPDYEHLARRYFEALAEQSTRGDR